MIVKSSLIFTILFSLSAYLSGQEVWSLEKCIEFALDNSLSLKQTQIDVADTELDLKTSKLNRIPNLSGNSTYSFSFGRRIDPTTNDFINQQFGNQSLSLSGGVLLFNGGQVNQIINQAKLAREAAGLEAQQMENDISLSVASSYLDILFASENLGNAQKTLELTNKNLEQIDKLISAGSRPRNARLDLVAQVAQNEQAIISSENNLETAYLVLKQLLHLHQDVDMVIEVPEIPLPSEYDVEVLDPVVVYNTAKSWQPKIKAGELRRQNAEVGVNLAKTAMIPALSIGGSVQTNYSSARKRQGEQVGVQEVNQDIFLNNEPFTIGFQQPIYAFDNVPYLDQLNENWGYGFGLQLSVPIFNQGLNKSNLEKARLNVIRTELTNQTVHDQLKSDIQLAVAELKASQKQYEATLKTSEATEAAFLDTEKRFELGVANSFEYITAQNNRDQAEVNLLIAKYDFIFRAKIVDYYQGKKISLN